MSLRVTAISDLHCKYPTLLGGDLLIDSGDWTYRGREQEVKDYLVWLKEQLDLYKDIVFIAGNHEMSAQDHPLKFASWLKPYLDTGRIHYLQEQEIIIDGFKIYGAPHQPEFGNWAFNVKRGMLYLHWDKIPDDTDILITHGPPYGYGDFVPERTWSYAYQNAGQEGWTDVMRHVGCNELLYAVQRVKPQYHIFGHIHYAHGKYYGRESDGFKDDEVCFINAALNNEAYDLHNKPINFIIDYPKSSP